MKKLLILAAAALALASCARGTQTVSVGLDGSIQIWKDKATGCQYVLTDDNITPRLGADGKPMCGGAEPST